MTMTAEGDLGGITSDEDLTALLKERRRFGLVRQAEADYARLRRDPKAWADYTAELDSLAGLHEVDITAAEEWPEHNR